MGQDLSGSQVNRSPKLRFSVAGSQDFNLGEYPAYVRLDYMWRDSNILDGDRDPNTFQDSYGLLNARIAIQATDNVELALWGRNLTDETYSLTKFDVPLFSGAYGHYPGKQRQIGLEEELTEVAPDSLRRLAERPPRRRIKTSADADARSDASPKRSGSAPRGNNGKRKRPGPPRGAASRAPDS